MTYPAKIESLIAERDALQSKLGDAIRSLANWQHQCTELQAENERLTLERDVNKRMRDMHFAEKSALAAQLDELRAVICGVGIVGKIAGHDVIVRESVIDLIDRRRKAAEAAHGIHAKGGQ